MDVVTDWPSIGQKEEEVPPMNPEYFKQNELMKDFTDWLKTQDGLDFGLQSSASSSAQNGADVVAQEVTNEPKVEKKEKQVWDLYLTEFDASKKITVIKEVRAATGLGLKEAKEAVEKAPTELMKNVKKEEVKEIVEKIEAAGGKIEFK